MDATTKPESAQEAGTQAPPTPEVSSPSAGQRPSEPVPSLDMDALVEKMLASPKFKQHVSGAVQSVKDKRFADLERFKTYLDQAGGDVRKAEREMRLDDAAERLLEQDGPGSPPARPNASELQTKTADILKTAGIPFDDAEVKALASRSYSSEGDWYREVTALAVRRARGESAPPASAIVNTSQGAPATDTTDKDTKIAQLTARLQELQRAPSNNWQEINRLDSELRKLVLPR